LHKVLVLEFDWNFRLRQAPYHLGLRAPCTLWSPTPPFQCSPNFVCSIYYSLEYYCFLSCSNFCYPNHSEPLSTLCSFDSNSPSSYCSICSLCTTDSSTSSGPACSWSQHCYHSHVMGTDSSCNTLRMSCRGHSFRDLTCYKSPQQPLQVLPSSRRYHERSQNSRPHHLPLPFPSLDSPSLGLACSKSSSASPCPKLPVN